MQKICPRCAQSVVLEVPICPQCAFAHPRPGIAKAHVPTLLSKVAFLLGSLFLILFLVLFLIGGIGFRTIGRASSVSTGSVLAPVPEPQSPKYILSSGPFLEKPGTQETPTLNLQGSEYELNQGTDTVYLHNAAGRIFTLTVPPGKVVSLQVPVGEYGYALIPSAPHLRGQNGQVTFRPYRQYDLNITKSSHATREDHPCIGYY